MRQKCYLTLATSHVWLISFSNAYLTWVAMWDRYFPTASLHRITLSRMRWYVRKNYLRWVKQW